MDGELLATDTARFATLKKLVDIDLADRREWFGRAERNRTERFKRTNTKKPGYEGAPNLVDPIIDDLVRELKQTCVTLLLRVIHAKARRREGGDMQYLKTPSGAKFLLTLHALVTNRVLTTQECSTHDYGVTAGMCRLLGEIENMAVDGECETDGLTNEG